MERDSETEQIEDSIRSSFRPEIERISSNFKSKGISKMLQNAQNLWVFKFVGIDWVFLASLRSARVWLRKPRDISGFMEIPGFSEGLPYFVSVED